MSVLVPPPTDPNGLLLLTLLSDDLTFLPVYSSCSTRTAQCTHTSVLMYITACTTNAQHRCDSHLRYPKQHAPEQTACPPPLNPPPPSTRHIINDAHIHYSNAHRAHTSGGFHGVAAWRRGCSCVHAAQYTLHTLYTQHTAWGR